MMILYHYYRVVGPPKGLYSVHRSVGGVCSRDPRVNPSPHPLPQAPQIQGPAMF